MCPPEEYISMYLRVIGRHGDHMMLTEVDACLAPLVYKMNNQGIETLNSCCRHGVDKGLIAISTGSVYNAIKLGYDVKQYNTTYWEDEDEDLRTLFGRGYYIDTEVSLPKEIYVQRIRGDQTIYDPFDEGGDWERPGGYKRELGYF